MASWKTIPEFANAYIVGCLITWTHNVSKTLLIQATNSPTIGGRKCNQPASLITLQPLEDDRVLMLDPAEPPAFYTPLTITCGAKQVPTCLETTMFDPQGRSLISIHLMLAAEQLRRPTLTLAKLWVELSLLYKRVELPRPKEWYAPGDSDTLNANSPVPIWATMDGVDAKFDACVVVDVFLPGIRLGPQELKCYNIIHQEPTGEARIDERASLVVSFVVPHAAPIPLRGLVDTGSDVSILTFSAFNRVAAQTGTVLKPYQIDSYAANGKTKKTFGLAEQIRFHLAVMNSKPISS